MKAARLTFLLSVLSTAAGAQTAGLTLTQGDIFSDAVGSVIAVSVRNDSPNPVDSVVVTCAFTAGGKPAGTASTTLFNLLPGTKGTDQVHFMGPKAQKAICQIAPGGTPAN